MTIEEFNEQKAAISDEKLAEMACISLSELCETGARSFKMTVPPRTDDTDIIFSELIRRFEKLIDQNNNPEKCTCKNSTWNRDAGCFVCDDCGSKI